jgi:hypothetical protein
MVHTIQIRIFKSFLKRIYYNPQSLQQGGCLICYYLSPPCMRKPTITRLDASLFWQGSRGISGQSHMLYVLNSLTTAYWLERFATCRFSIAGPRAWWNPIGVIFVPLRTDNRKAKNPRFSLAFVHFCHAIGHHRSHRTVGWWFGTWLLFSISYMGCNPSHWRTPSFFKMVIAPPTRIYYVEMVPLGSLLLPMP